VRGVVKAAAIGNKRVMFNGVAFDLSRFNNVPAFSGQQTEAQTMSTQAETTETPPAEPKPKPGEQAPPNPAPPPPATAPVPPPKPGEQPAAEPTSFADGVKAERARIAALQAYDRPATHDIVVKAIADGKTVADVMPELFAAVEKKGQQQARRTDAQQLEQVPPTDAGETGEAGDDFGNRLKAAVKARLGRGRKLLHSRN